MELSPWRYKTIPIMALIFLLATGCTSPVPEIGDLTSTANGRTPTNPIVKTEQRGTPTHRVVPTLAPTIMVSNVTPTVTRPLSTTQLLQWTPGAKLPPDEAEKKIMKFYSNNGGCELPCWWGITPGMTTGEKALSILAPLAQVRISEWEDGLFSYGVSAKFPSAPDPFKNFMASFFVKDNIVIAIRITADDVEPKFDYSLAGILNAFGQPDQIWFKIITDTMNGRPHFDYNLFFASRGINIFINENATIELNFVKVCPQDILNRNKFPPGMTLWSPAVEIHFDDLPVYVPNLEVAEFRMLEDLTDEIDTKSFFETYRNPKTTKCFRIPLDRIPGYVTPYP